MTRKATLDQYLQIGKKISDGDLDRETAQAIVEGRIRVVPREQSFGANEYLVYVDYAPFPSFADLEKEFGAGNISNIFDKPFLMHVLCEGLDQTPGNRVMRLVWFGRRTGSMSNIVEMDKQGYRPATHLEAYAFWRAHPVLCRPFRIAALGSFAYGKRHRHRYVVVLRGDSDTCVLGPHGFSDDWDAETRFLFVRKQP